MGEHFPFRPEEAAPKDSESLPPCSNISVLENTIEISSTIEYFIYGHSLHI